MYNQINEKNAKVYIHLAEGFEEVEALAVVDILRRACLDVSTVKIASTDVCARDCDLMVNGAHGIGVKADLIFAEADYEACDMIVLPGGMPGTMNLGNHAGLMTKIRDFSNKGKWLAAICAAPMVFAKEGVLSGKHATIYPGMEEHLLRCAPEPAIPTGEPVVVDGKVITGRGPGVAIEFALVLCEMLCGEKKAAEIESDLTL